MLASGDGPSPLPRPAGARGVPRLPGSGGVRDFAGARPARARADRAGDLPPSARLEGKEKDVLHYVEYQDSDFPWTGPSLCSIVVYIAYTHMVASENVTAK